MENDIVKKIQGLKILKVNHVPSALGDSAVELLFPGYLTVRISLDGECCSTSYFTDVTQFNELEGAIINNIVETDLGEIPNDPECTRAHFLTFVTDKGYATIDWRNDSNGYYDGNVVWSIV